MVALLNICRIPLRSHGNHGATPRTHSLENDTDSPSDDGQRWNAAVKYKECQAEKSLEKGHNSGAIRASTIVRCAPELV